MDWRRNRTIVARVSGNICFSLLNPSAPRRVNLKPPLTKYLQWPGASFLRRKVWCETQCWHCSPTWSKRCCTRHPAPPTAPLESTWMGRDSRGQVGNSKECGLTEVESRVARPTCRSRWGRWGCNARRAPDRTRNLREGSGGHQPTCTRTLRGVETLRLRLTLADVVNAYGHAEELGLSPDVSVELDLLV